MKGMHSVGKTFGLLVAVVAVPAVSGCAGIDARPGSGVESPSAGVVIEVSKAARVVMGPDRWNGEADCSAVARLQRTDTAIVVTVDVRDDSVRVGEEGTYTNDSVELYFDVRGEKARGSGYYDKGVFQLVVTPAAAGRELRSSWHYGEGGDPGWATVAGMEATSEMLPGGYRIVVTLPLEGFKKNHAMPGETFNFALGVNDYDEGPAERTQLMSSGTDENWLDPSGFAPVSP